MSVLGGKPTFTDQREIVALALRALLLHLFVEMEYTHMGLWRSRRDGRPGAWLAQIPRLT